MKRKLIIVVIAIGLTSFFAGCSSSDQANTNANQTITTAGPDNSEIVTTTDSTGTRTETRTFRDNPRVARVVVTTREGRRTVKVYSKTGEERDVPEAVGDALAVTGDKLADAAGFVAAGAETVADKTKEGVNEVGDKAEDVADKAKTVGKEVGKEVADKAEDVGDKAASTAKTAGSKTVSGAKKAGKTIKKVVTP